MLTNVKIIVYLSSLKNSKSLKIDLNINIYYGL
jgi:hypothetical protein